MNSVTQTEQSLASIALRLQVRPEARALAKEISSAREGLLWVDDTVKLLQQSCEQSLDALLQSEAQVRLALHEVEKEIRQQASAHYLLRFIPKRTASSSVQERLAKIRHLLLSIENASFSFGLGSCAAKLRQAVFAFEDSVKRHEFLLRTRANALRERSLALQQAQQLLHRLVLQSKLLFPVVPVFLEIENCPLPRAA